MTADGHYTAKEVDQMLMDLKTEMIEKINRVVVVGKNGIMPANSNPTSLLLSVEEDRDTENSDS